MIVTKSMLIGMVCLSVTTSGILLYQILHESRLSGAGAVQDTENADGGEDDQMQAEKPVYTAIAEKNLFMPNRGQKNVSAALEKKEERKDVPELNMLGAYPNDWPRLKLTGVFMLGSRRGALITGGTAKPSTAGTVYDSLYFEGDEIGGGVYLFTVSSSSVILRKDQNGWPISIGVEPPAVPKK